MKPKTINTTYWVVTILFALAMLGDAYGGITKQEAGAVVLKHLGYPLTICRYSVLQNYWGLLLFCNRNSAL